jgi:uncharacterized repeat protein (TIGR01451 family)
VWQDWRGSEVDIYLAEWNRPPGADLSVKITSDPDPASLGYELTYSVTAINYGPDAATGVQLTFTLPQEVGFISALAPQGTWDYNESERLFTWYVGSLAAPPPVDNSSASIEIVARALAVGRMTNTAEITADQDDNVPDNNTATLSNHITRFIIETVDEGEGPALAVDSAGTAHLLYTNDSGLVYATNPTGSW